MAILAVTCARDDDEGRCFVGGSVSAEEFFSRCQGNSAILDAAARRLAHEGDPVSALACAWGSDVYAAQAVLWERVLVAASSPRKQFFRVADALMDGMSAADPEGGHSTVRDVVAASRRDFLASCEPELRGGVEATWNDLGYLSGLRAPSGADLENAAGNRTAGLDPVTFALQRRREAAAAMGEARGLRVRGEPLPAIQAAFESDLLMLEAYLVESARAAGDIYLLSVVIRWELTTKAVAGLPGLPDVFVAAVSTIRESLVNSLGDADGARLADCLLEV